jgi:hypothetical protein
VLSVVIALGLINVALTILSLWFPFSPVRPRLSVLCFALDERAPELVESIPVSVPAPTFESLDESLLDHPVLDLAAPDEATISVEISNDELRTSASRSTSSESSGWGTISAPGADDPFNSPGGGLAQPGQFQGERLVVWTNEPWVINEIFPDDNPLWGHLDQMGFDVHRVSGRFDTGHLSDANQIWIFAGARSGMGYDDYRAVEEFVKSGGGLYLCSDNDPYIAESVELCRRLFGCRVRGNYLGRQLLGVLDERGRRPAMLAPGRPKIAHDNWQRPHDLLAGINCIYEGDTISTITSSRNLHTVLRASNGRTLAALGKHNRRVCVDCGFTRYFRGHYRIGTEQGAGTSLWATNVAAYLGAQPSRDE